MSIGTGWVANCIHVTALPMPDDVIERINKLAEQQKMNSGLVFADRNLNVFDEDNKNELKEDDIDHDDQYQLDNDDQWCNDSKSFHMMKTHKRKQI